MLQLSRKSWKILWHSSGAYKKIYLGEEMEIPANNLGGTDSNNRKISFCIQIREDLNGKEHCSGSMELNTACHRRLRMTEA